jgi:hypothetical protein
MLRRLVSISVLHSAARSSSHTTCQSSVVFRQPHKCIVSRLVGLPALVTRHLSTEITFEHASDETLESLCEHLEVLIDDDPRLSEADVTLASGVLTLVLPPPHGTFVINKVVFSRISTKVP